MGHVVIPARMVTTKQQISDHARNVMPFALNVMAHYYKIVHNVLLV